jgi:two-component system CheB/CheR fusion protein
MVVFSTHNLIKDAPFSRLDLVTCRNLLIYLRPTIQKRVLRILNYSLLPTGYLMLGTSETVGESSEYFTLLDRKNKIYSKRHVASLGTLDMVFGVQATDVPRSVDLPSTQRATNNLSGTVDRKIIEIYGPPGVVINDDLDVVHIRGRTGPYLEPMPGAPSFNILRLARPALHADLRRAIHEAKSRREQVTVESHLIEGEADRTIQIEVVPITEPESKAPFLLVLFREPKPPTPPALDVPPASVEDDRSTELERELMVTKEYLQSTIEELESANEELKSSNEELQSSNEELQSTNEELETSKEELQSANEELTTVNEEAQNRMTELQLANDDLHNVLSAIGEAIVIVGLDLRIRRFTHVAEELLNLVATDVGRSVSQLNAFVIGERIEDLAQRVIEHLAPVERELSCADHRRYRIRILPYKTLDHAIKGAVIILVGLDAPGTPAPGGGGETASGILSGRERWTRGEKDEKRRPLVASGRRPTP